jgi:IS30 family transposase
MAKYKQMILEDRITIERGLENHESFKAIGLLIGKDCTTISKEVRSHLVFKKSGAYGRPFNNCMNRTHCQLYGICDTCSFGSEKRDHRCASCRRCTDTCPGFKEEICPKLLKPPYVCNGCKDRRFCTLEKRIYDAASAQDEYSTILSESRLGAAVSDGDINRLDAIISPLLIKGQSLHHIYLNHRDELMVSERTFYKYVDAGLFKARNIDMPRAIRVSPHRKKPDMIKVDTKCREGRTRTDYEAFIRKNPDTPVVQLDSVEGIKNGAVLLTVTFVSTGLQLAFRRDHNDARSVSDIFDRLYMERKRSV